MHSHEISSINQENNSENPWSELEKLGEQGFNQENSLAELEEQEREKLAQEMGMQREALARRREEQTVEHFREQRTQEILERDLNSKLLTVDQMETEVLSGNPEIRKTTFPYEDTEIPIYHLEGLPFSLLSTTIDYRRANKSGEIGTETYQELLKNPAIWAERRDQAEQSSGFGTRTGNARGDTISASYSNSERNMETYYPGDLFYGFEHVDADSVITVNSGDGATSNMAGRSLSDIGDYHKLESLEGPNQTDAYNEISLRRYSENGMPKLPDYIIVRDGNFTSTAFRHAKFFNVPIVHIDSAVYEQKAKQKGEAILDSVSEQDDYPKIEEKLSELLSMSAFNRRLYHRIDKIGRGHDTPHLPDDATSLQKKCLEISKLELSKRIEFIKDSLEEITKTLEDATAAGSSASQETALIRGPYIEFIDTQNNKTRRNEGDKDGYFMHDADGPVNCNKISITFNLKGSSMPQEIKVFDGERTNRPDVFQDQNHADSSYYDTLEPVVLKYFEALRANQQIPDSQD